MNLNQAFYDPKGQKQYKICMDDVGETFYGHLRHNTSFSEFKLKSNKNFSRALDKPAYCVNCLYFKFSMYHVQKT